MTTSLRSTLPRYFSMEAGGLLEVRPAFFFVVGEGLTFLTHIQSYMAPLQIFVFDRSIKQRNPVLLD